MWMFIFPFKGPLSTAPHFFVLNYELFVICIKVIPAKIKGLQIAINTSIFMEFSRVLKIGLYKGEKSFFFPSKFYSLEAKFHEFKL